MRYKDKYILFYLEGKKRLSEKEISRLLGISSQDDMPDSREIDQRNRVNLLLSKLNMELKFGNILIYDILMVEIKIPL